MKKLLGLTVLLPLVISGGPTLAAALWEPAIALLPLTAIVSLAARKPPWSTFFFLNLGLVVLIGLIGAGGQLPGGDGLDRHGQSPIGGKEAGNDPARQR